MPARFCPVLTVHSTVCQLSKQPQHLEDKGTEHKLLCCWDISGTAFSDIFLALSSGLTVSSSFVVLKWINQCESELHLIDERHSEYENKQLPGCSGSGGVTIRGGI